MLPPTGQGKEAINFLEVHLHQNVIISDRHVVMIAIFKHFLTIFTFQLVVLPIHSECVFKLVRYKC